MIQEAKNHNATDYLVIAGDFFNFDALSRYDPKQPDAGLETEIAYGEEILKIALEAFDTIYITKGNHDERITSALGFKLRFEHTIKMCFPSISRELLDRVIVTGNDYLIVDTPNGQWYCCHTKQYSKNPLTVPRDLCDIHLMHVAAGHRHHHAIGKSRNNRFYAVELGGAFDRDKTNYLRNYSTTFPIWTNGFMILVDGIPYLPLLAPTPIKC